MPRSVRALIEALVPSRLGSDFRWLLSSSTVMNVGDGVVIAAGPLLMASLTRDPFLVSLAAFFEYVPSLVVGTVAGVIVDRVDRRRVIIAMNLARAAIVAVLVATILGQVVNIAIVLASILALGVAETFADLGSLSLLPRLVARKDLGLANARLEGATILTNQLLGPPIGAFLFVVGTSLPFAGECIGFALGAVLLSRMTRPARVGVRADRAPTRFGVRTELRRLGAELGEGFGWLRHHAPMRTLALTILSFNVTFGAAWGVLVLYAQERLGMGSVGFGLLTTAIAVGGIIATVSYGWLERHVRLSDLMRVGLLIETGTHLTLALTRSPVVALGVMVVFGAHAFVWWTTSTAVRQRAVPDAVMGRVSGIYQVALTGGLVVGTPIGGLLARGYGLTAPFWFGFVGSAILVSLLWRQFDHIVHSAEAADGETGASGAGSVAAVDGESDGEPDAGSAAAADGEPGSSGAESAAS